jgi:hypothetical protein
MKNEVTKSSNEWDWVAMFEDAIKAYRNKNWQEAIELFSWTIALRGGTDRASSLYIDRCMKFMVIPPSDDCKGVTILGSK